MTIKEIWTTTTSFLSHIATVVILIILTTIFGFNWFMEYQTEYDRQHMTEVTVTIVDVYEEKATMGCMGTDMHTIVKADDNRTSKLCGRLGKVGDKIKGCWMTGHWDQIRNGFRLDC